VHCGRKLLFSQLSSLHPVLCKIPGSAHIGALTGVGCQSAGKPHPGAVVPRDRVCLWTWCHAPCSTRQIPKHMIMHLPFCGVQQYYGFDLTLYSEFILLPCYVTGRYPSIVVSASYCHVTQLYVDAQQEGTEEGPNHWQVLLLSASSLVRRHKADHQAPNMKDTLHATTHNLNLCAQRLPATSLPGVSSATSALVLQAQ
jgi:hypothetical protein